MSSKELRKSAYFIGIGGIGMSAFARYLHAKKWHISGSDGQRSSITDELKKEGLKVKIGQKTGVSEAKTPRSGRFKNLERVIYNRAIRPDNPEFVAARQAGVPLIPYAEALGEITREYETIAITGSHGKSTTTALATVMLLGAGLDPTVLVGTKLADLGGKNMRVGKGKYLVLEADDYQAAFLNYSPSIAIVTNIDREHMDFYKTFANVKKSFLGFLSRTREGGTLILNKDNEPLRSLAPKIAALATRRRLKVIWYSTKGAATADIRKHLAIPGAHNVSNASAVYALGRMLGISSAKILSALHSYHGAWRRMEYRGTAEVNGTSVKVFDDYAHHPSEIKATVAAFREKFPRDPLFVIFQPHQARRLEALFKEFTSSFDAADAVWIAPLYKVAGRDETTTCDSLTLVTAMQKRSPQQPVFYIENLKHLDRAVAQLLKTPRFHSYRHAVLVLMGAGNIVDHTDGFIVRYSKPY